MPDLGHLDWPFFEDGHRALARELRGWAEREVAPIVQDEPSGRDGLDDLVKELLRRLADGGWLRYAVPAPWGGVHETLDRRALCLLREILAWHSGIADLAFVMQGLGSGPISLFGSEEMRRRYLPEVAAGRRVAAFALSEPQSGSDVAAIATTAERDGDAYVIDGEKTLISNGGLAHQYVVFARTGEAPGARGLSAFVVDADTPGFSVAERFDVIAPHPLARLRFEGCRVPRSHLLGGPGDGFKVAMASLDVFRPTVGAAALGFARRACDEAVAHAARRRSFGKPLAEHQLVQAKIADMAVRIDAAALLVCRAAWAGDTGGGRITREAAMAKLHATESAQEVVDEAVQIFGGMGVVTGSAVERLYREVRALRIYEGASEIQRLIIAGQTMARAAAGET